MYKTSLPEIYEISAAQDALPLIFDSPHSGRAYPPDFAFSCSREALEKAEDRYVDLLFGNVPCHGGTLLSALFPRTYIDVNRAIDDIEPELLEEPWPGNARPTSRAAAGIGLIRRMLNPGQPLYNRPLSAEEIRARIDGYYIPYHHALERLIGEAHRSFGRVWHMNCHSMPSYVKIGSLYYSQKRKLADFVIGDREGTSCESEFVMAIKNHLEKYGFKVALNEPFSGVELVRKYSDPSTGKNSLQLEINRALYLDENTNEPSSDYGDFSKIIDELVKFCADYVSSKFLQMAAD